MGSSLLASAGAEVDVRHDHIGLEDDPVVVRARLHRLKLLNEERDVIRLL